MCSVENLFIQFGAKWNDTTCLFIFFDWRNSLNSLSAERRFFWLKTLETVQFWQFSLDFSVSTKIIVFQSKYYFRWKHEIETENKNQRTAPRLLELRRLQTAANTKNLVSKLTPTFRKLNLLSIPTICFHFLYFYLILFIYFLKSLLNIFSRHYDSVKWNIHVSKNTMWKI